MTSAAAPSPTSAAAAAAPSLLQKPLICGGHSRPVPFLQYSNITEDGSFFLISACLDGKPMFRNGVTGDWIGTFLGHKGAVWCAKANADASQVITASADYTAKVWDALTGEELHSFDHKHIVKTCDFSSDNRRVVTGGQEKLIRVFDLGQPSSANLMAGHAEGIKSVIWGPDAHTIISCSPSEQIKVWDVRMLQEVRRFGPVTKAPITGIELTQDGSNLTVTAGKEISFWSCPTFELEKSHTLAHEVNTASLHKHGNRFVAGTDFWVRVFEFDSGKELEVHKGHHGPVHCIRFAPDFETYASGSEDGTIRLWQTTIKSYGLWELVEDASAAPAGGLVV